MRARRVQPHNGLNTGSGILLGKTWATKGEAEWQSRQCSVIPESKVGPRVTVVVLSQERL